MRVGDVLRMNRRPVDIQPESEYRAFGMRSFGRGTIRYVPTIGSGLTKLPHFKFNSNALVLSNIKAWEGAVGVTDEEDAKCVASSRFLFYEPRGEEVDVRYMRYFFLTRRGLGEIGKASRGSADRNRTLSIRAFEQIKISLPHPVEQRRIADKLDLLLTEQAKAMVQSPSVRDTQQLMTSGLDKVLGRWAQGFVRVDNVCRMVSDTVHPGADRGEATEFVGLEHIAPHFGERIGSRPLGEEKGRKFRFAPGDILYGYLRPYLNKVWLADQHGLCSVEQYVLRPTGGMPAELIAAGLRSKRTLDEVLGATHNLQLPRLRSGLLLAMEIPFIPPANQAQALADLEEFDKKVRELARAQQHRDEVLAALRPAVLDAAFSGRL
ncbi:hypothetical protein [Streptomyces rubiginosohelvolus]